MTVTDYQATLADQLAAASTPNNPLAIREAIPGDKIRVLTLSQECFLVIGPPEETRTVMVICGMTPKASAEGLCIACCALDALALGNRDWRNKLLERLHLYDGKAANGLRHATQARGWELAVQVNHPAKGLMSYTYHKL